MSKLRILAGLTIALAWLFRDTISFLIVLAILFLMIGGLIYAA